MKKILVVISLYISFIGNTQFIDFNLFKPRVSLGTQYILQNNSDSLSIGLQDHYASAFFPIKSKLSVDMDWKNVFKSKGLKDAFVKTVNPKFYQVFGRVGGGYRTYTSSIFDDPVNVYHVSAGISGINLRLKSGKLRFLMYSLNVRLQEQFDKYTSISPSISGMLGAVHVSNSRSIYFYGIYANYFGKRILPAPILGAYYKLNNKVSALLVFPQQAKLSISFNKISQDFAVSLNSFSNGVYNDSLIPHNSIRRLNFQHTNLRISSQTRFILGKKSFLYLEAGWQEFNSYTIFNGSHVYDKNNLKGTAFVKATIRVALGKSLFNSSIFNLDI